MALGRRRLGPHDGLHEGPQVLLQRLGAERLLAHGRVHDAALVHPELDLARLQFLDRPSHVHGHGARLGLGISPRGPSTLPSGPNCPITSGVATIMSVSSQPSLIFWTYSTPT